MRRTVLQTLAALTASLFRRHEGNARTTGCFNWLVFYGPTADERLLSSYDIVVLDSMFQGSIAAVAKAGARVCGYLSLGEIRTSDAFFGRLDPRALLEQNPAWPDARRIDVRQQSWKTLVLADIIPSLVTKGYTGLFLDTLDTPPYLEQLDPAGNSGMRQAAVDLVRSIRKAHPGMMMIVNRGYALLPDIIACIDGIVAESLLTRPDQGHARNYVWNEPSEVALQLSLLAPAMHRRPVLPIFSLDYWNPEDPATIREIYRREQQLGHHPYVGTRMLDTIIPKPVL